MRSDTYEPTPDEKVVMAWLRYWENGPLDEDGSDPITGYLIVESGAIAAFADAIERGEHREDT
jgi:hypothetical protein